VLWARTTTQLQERAEGLRAMGRRVHCATVDVGQSGQVETAARLLDQEVGLAGLVLSAGEGRWCSLLDMEPGTWSATISTNLTGTYNVVRAVLPLLTTGPAGLVVSLLSDSALYPFPGRAAYAAAKSGASAFLEVLRREVRQSGLRVSAVLPSRVDTHFQGSHRQAAPGTRPGALTAAQVGEVIATLFDFPANVEIRQIHLAAMTSEFGLFPEKVL
jgi:NADP-dependent 3-hydroxy acid dehydrogenase YdfG